MELRNIVRALTSLRLKKGDGRIEERLCRVCDLEKIEDEYHVFLECLLYQHIRTLYKIDVVDYYTLLQLSAQLLNVYINDIVRFHNIILCSIS